MVLQPDTAILYIWHDHDARILLLPLYFIQTVIINLYAKHVSQQHCTCPGLPVSHTLYASICSECTHSCCPVQSIHCFDKVKQQPAQLTLQAQKKTACMHDAC